MSSIYSEINEQVEEKISREFSHRGLTVNRIDCRHSDVLDPAKFSFVFEVDFEAAIGFNATHWYHVGPGTEEIKFNHNLIDSQENPHNCPLLIRDDGHDLVISSYLLDKKLGAVLTDPEFNQFIPADGEDGVGIVGIELIRYVPGSRLVRRVKVSSDGPPEITSTILYAKTFRKKESAEKSFKTSKRLSKHLNKSLGRVKCVVPLFYHKEFNTVWSRALPGRLMQDLLNENNIEQRLSELVENMVYFNTSPDLKLDCKDYSPVEEFKRFKKIKKKLIRNDAGLQKLSDFVEGSLRKQMDSIDFEPVLVHGSFRANHILVDENNYYLLDMDSVGTASVEFDPANFITALYFQVLKSELDERLADLISEHLINNYMKFYSGSFYPAIFNWYLLNLFFRKQIYKIVRQGMENSRQTIEFLMSKSGQIADKLK